MPSENAQEKRVWTIRVCRFCGTQACDGHCRPDDYADPAQIAVVPESALREAEAREAKLREVLERIEERATHPPPGPPTNWTRIEWVAEIARTALARVDVTEATRTKERKGATSEWKRNDERNDTDPAG